jgi:hypothetical protein
LNKQVEATKLIVEEHKAVWKKTGCTIMTDGWTDRRRITILNFLVNSPKGIVFLKSIDASYITKTAVKIFKMMDEVVDEIGEENMAQVVTDNATIQGSKRIIDAEAQTLELDTLCSSLHQLDVGGF